MTHAELRRKAAVARGARAVKRVAAPLALCAGMFVFITQTNQHYPIDEWLFWHYLGAWLGAAAFALSSLVAGEGIVKRILGGRRWPAREMLCTGFAIGALAFGVGLFVCGVLHLFAPFLFFVWPPLLAAPFVRDFVRCYARFARRISQAKRPLRKAWFWVLPLTAVALALAYVPLITPGNITFDARWYHLPVAEHYAAAGHITRFDEGWILGAYPQLGSLYYTWAMLMPFGRYFDRAMLCVHIEWALFLATVVSLPTLVRRIAPGVSGLGAGLAIFLFPGLYLYDSSLGGGGDHITAAFTPALWLCLLRAWPALGVRECVLFGLALAATALTKYTAVIPLLPATGAFALRFFWLVAKSFRARAADTLGRRALAGALACTLALLCASSIHWGKNLLFYRDPLFPLLNRHLTPNPWSTDARAQYEHLANQVMASAPHTLEGVLDTLRTALTFAFVPHDWPYLHGSVPVFGCLFTLAWLVIPFVEPRARIVALGLAAEAGVMSWYWTHHLDRFLQALVPWMAAVTAAVVALAWKRGFATRALAAAWCALQAIWGGDVPFIPSHTMLGDTPFRVSAHLLAEGYAKHYEERYSVSEFELIGATLPKDAKVLIHLGLLHAGLQRMAVNDSMQSQTGLSYADLGSERKLYDELKRWGVTHVLRMRGASDIEMDSIAGDLVFAAFTDRYTDHREQFGAWTLTSLPAEPPPNADHEANVVYLGCEREGRYSSGLYRLSAMRQLYDAPFPAPREPEPKDAALLPRFLKQAEFLVIDECRAHADELHEGFTEIYRRLDSTLYMRH